MVKFGLLDNKHWKNWSVDIGLINEKESLKHLPRQAMYERSQHSFDTNRADLSFLHKPFSLARAMEHMFKFPDEEKERGSIFNRKVQFSRGSTRNNFFQYVFPLP